MVVLLPLVLLLFAFSIVRGQSNLVLILPVLLMVAVGGVFVMIALRDGRRPPDPSVRRLPTGHLRRQMYLALKPRRPRRPPGEGPPGGSPPGKGNGSGPKGGR